MLTMNLEEWIYFRNITPSNAATILNNGQTSFSTLETLVFTQSYFKYKVNSTEFGQRHLGPKYKLE